MGNACVYSCSPCQDQNKISTDILRAVEGMQHVDGLIEYVDQLVEKIDRGEQVQVPKPILVASSIKCGGDLMEKLSKRLNRHVCKKCLLSTLDRQTRKVVIDVLNQAHHIQCVGIALSIIAHLLERAEQVSSNKDQCLHLLRYMSALAKHMKNLDIHLDRAKLDKILRFIVKGTLICALQMKANILCRFISSPLDDDDLRNLESQLVHSYWDLEFEALTAVLNRQNELLANTQNVLNTQNELLANTQNVLNRLPIVPGPSQGENPWDAVGMEEAQKEVTKLLDLAESSLRVVIIYGVGGIGKTTLASTVFKSLDLTGYHYCRVDIDQDCRHIDLQAIQKQILSDVFEINMDVNNCNKGLEKLSEAFRNASKPVFLFMDNALKQSDLEMLLPIQHLSRLPMQSRILVTTRDLNETKIFEHKDGIQVFSHRVDSVSQAEAKRLLCHYALGDENGSFEPGVNMDGLLQFCGGIPLLIGIVGFRLRAHGNSESACNEILEYYKEWQQNGLEGGQENLSECMVDFVYKRLKEPSQQAFLDIAFFFYDWEQCKVADIVGEVQLEDLKGAALVTTSEEDGWVNHQKVKMTVVKMHDIVRALGRKLSDGNRITDRESLSILLRDEQKLRQTKGIWLPYDEKKFNLEAKHVDLMSRSLRVLSLDGDTRVNGRCEKSFEHLRVLRISYEDMLPIHLTKSRQLVYFEGRLMKGRRFPKAKFTPYDSFLDPRIFFFICLFPRLILKERILQFPESLRILSFYGPPNFPPVCLDIKGHLTALREIHLSNITLANFENGIRQLKFLRSLQLDTCEGFTSILESFENFSSLKILGLYFCSKLERLPESFGNLSSLQSLNISYCSLLERLPESFLNLSCLQILDISGCSKLERLPESFENLLSLKELYIHSCSKLEKLPESFGNLSSLQRLSMYDCSVFEKLPESFGNLSSLQRLSMYNCSVFEKLPESFGNLSSLQRLQISNCSKLKRLLESFGNLSSLQELYMSNCSKLERLPESFWDLSSLQTLNISGCSELKSFPESFGNLSSLQILDISRCSKLERLPESFGDLSSMRELNTSYCSMLKRLPESFVNLSLQRLNISYCSMLERLESFVNLSSLQRLHISGCSKLERLLESFDNLSSLQELYMSNFSKLERLPESFGNLSSLQRLKISGCSMLERLPQSFENLSTLQELSMSGCFKLERLPESFGYHCSLKTLNISDCSKLERLPQSFVNLSSLETLNISNCSKLERLPESFGSLSSLLKLNTSGCSMLDRLPESFGDLSFLQKLNTSGCSMLERLPESFGDLSSLQQLNTSGCSMLERLPESFGNLSSLRELNTSGCSMLERLPESFGNLSYLQILNTSGCSMLERLPESFANLSYLQKLEISGCSKLERLFGSLSSLQKLYLSDCSMLERLPESFWNISSLQKLDISGCSLLERLLDSFGNLSSLQTLRMHNYSNLERLPQTFDQLSCLQSFEIDGCQKMCSLLDNFGRLKCLKFLSIRNCKELKRLAEDIVCLPSLAAVRAYGCDELEAKAMDSFVEIKSLIFLEMGESPMLIKRWEEIQQQSPTIGAALRFDNGKYPHEEIMSRMFFCGERRFLEVDSDGQLVEVASSSFPDVGVKMGLWMTACDLSDEGREKLVEVASSEFQIIYVDVGVEWKAEGSSWMEERDKRIKNKLVQLPQGSLAWTSLSHKTTLLFAYSLWHFTGSFASPDTSIVGTSVLVDEEGRRRLSPLEMKFPTDRNNYYSGWVQLRTLFSPLLEASARLVGKR